MCIVEGCPEAAPARWSSAVPAVSRFGLAWESKRWRSGQPFSLFPLFSPKSKGPFPGGHTATRPAAPALGGVGVLSPPACPCLGTVCFPPPAGCPEGVPGAERRLLARRPGIRQLDPSRPRHRGRDGELAPPVSPHGWAPTDALDTRECSGLGSPGMLWIPGNAPVWGSPGMLWIPGDALVWGSPGMLWMPRNAPVWGSPGILWMPGNAPVWGSPGMLWMPGNAPVWGSPGMLWMPGNAPVWGSPEMLRMPGNAPVWGSPEMLRIPWDALVWGPWGCSSSGGRGDASAPPRGWSPGQDAAPEAALLGVVQRSEASEEGVHGGPFLGCRGPGARHGGAAPAAAAMLRAPLSPHPTAWLSGGWEEGPGQAQCLRFSLSSLACACSLSA